MKTTLYIRSFAIAVMIGITTLSSPAQTFWEEMPGPYGVALWAFLVTKDGTYYAGSGDGKVYRRLPGADRWKIALTTTGTILALAENEGQVYVSDADGLLAATKDNGDSWELLNEGLEGEHVRCMLFTPDGDFFVGTSAGIHKRVPGAEPGTFKWQVKPYESNYGNYIFSMAAGADGTLYAGAGRGLYRSNDQGETWTLSAFAEQANTIHSIECTSNGDVYAATSELGLFKNPADDGQPDRWVYTGGEELEELQVRKISVLHGNELYASVSGFGTYYSANGSDWSLLMTQDSRAGVFYDETTDALAFGTITGIWTTPANAEITLTQIGLPLNTTYLTSYKSTLITLANNARLHATSDQGQTWAPRFGNGEGIVTAYAEKDNLERFAACWGGFSGSPWVQVYMRISGVYDWWLSVGLDEHVEHITDVLVTSRDSVYAATDQGVYYIDTKRYEGHFLSRVADDVNILSLVEDVAGNIYAATSDGLFISTDHGFNWPIHLLEGEQVNGLAFAGAEEVYAATESGLYFIPSFEGEPTMMDNGLNAGPYSSIARDDHGHLYATGGKGVYYAESATAAWVLQLEGVEGYECRKVRAVDNAVYLSTDVGVYRHDFAQFARINLSGTGDFVYNAAPRPVTATTVPAGLPVTVLYNGATGVPEEGGYYRVTARVNDPAYAAQTQGAVTIKKADATVTLAGLGMHYYTGAPVTVTATTVPAGLPVVIAYNTGAEVPVEIGEYFVIATINHRSYKGAASGDLLIQDPIMGTEDPANPWLSLSPVPTTDQVVIESRHDRIRSVQVLDVMGRPLQHVALPAPASSCSLNVRQHPPGILLFHVTTEKNQRVVKRGEVIR